VSFAALPPLSTTKTSTSNASPPATTRLLAPEAASVNADRMLRAAAPEGTTENTELYTDVYCGAENFR